MSLTGQRLRLARKRKNLKQTQVRERTGIHNKTLSGYENDVSEPDLETLRKLAALYEVSVDWLTGLTDEPAPAASKERHDEIEGIFFYELEQLSMEDKQKVLEHIRYLRYLAETENKR